jgi:hypothetical protein
MRRILNIFPIVNVIPEIWLVGFIVYNATYNNISVILWRRNPEDPEKITYLSQVTDKLYHIKLYNSP